MLAAVQVLSESGGNKVIIEPEVCRIFLILLNYVVYHSVASGAECGIDIFFYLLR